LCKGGEGGYEEEYVCAGLIHVGCVDGEMEGWWSSLLGACLGTVPSNYSNNMLGLLRAEEQRLDSFVVAIHRQRILTTVASGTCMGGSYAVVSRERLFASSNPSFGLSPQPHRVELCGTLHVFLGRL
jgi:hypothetical protein